MPNPTINVATVMIVISFVKDPKAPWTMITEINRLITSKPPIIIANLLN